MWPKIKAKLSTNPFTSSGIDSKLTDDRYYNLATSKRNWQLACFLQLIAIIIMSVQLGRVAIHAKVEPWLIVLNDNVPLNVLKGTPLSKNQMDLVISTTLRKVIIDSRSVINNEVAEKKLLDQTYALAANRSIPFLNEWYHTNNPFVIAERNTVEVQIIECLKVSNATYEIRWKENNYSLASGEVVGKTQWVAQINYTQVENGAADISSNPFGIYITDLIWSKIT